MGWQEALPVYLFAVSWKAAQSPRLFQGRRTSLDLTTRRMSFSSGTRFSLALESVQARSMVFCHLYWRRWMGYKDTKPGDGELAIGTSPRKTDLRLQWDRLFIIEGVTTIAISFVSFFIIVPFPEDSNFLKPDEKALLLARLKDDGGAVAHDELPIRRLLQIFQDWKIWAAVFIYLGGAENANSIASFQPTILRGIGYTSTGAQIRTIVAAVFSLYFAYLSEYLQKRYIFCMIGFLTIIAGLIVEIVQPKQPGVRYMGLFFMTAGAYLVMPLTIVWIAINVGKGYKRTIALGAISSFGNAGAFISTNVFLKSEEPKFRTGFSTGIGLAAIGMIAATVMFVGIFLGNKLRDERRKELPDVLDEITVEDLGEKHPDFRYCL
jgi:hypothetical protein